MVTVQDIFDPVKFSLEENRFLLAHLGEPSSVALREVKPVPLPSPARDTKTGRIIDRNPVHYPDGVIPAAVKPLLDRVYELIDLEKHFGQKWVGVEKLKERINIYLSQQEKWMEDKRRFRRAPRFPSMHSFDARKRPHRGGPGSDSGTVSTYFEKGGERKEFRISLFSDGQEGDWSPDWEGSPDATPVPVEATKKLIDDPEKNRIECPICHHTESYRPDSRGSFNAARARMSKHTIKETREPELHRELHTNEFGA
jgi:hypothetical protein